MTQAILLTLIVLVEQVEVFLARDDSCVMARQSLSITLNPAHAVVDEALLGALALGATAGVALVLLVQCLGRKLDERRVHAAPAWKPPAFEPRTEYCRTRPPLAAGAGGADGEVTHAGRCHCGRVAFEVDAPAALVAWDCNCSNCHMRRNAHFVVPRRKLRVARGAWRATSTYRFGSGVARHVFCRTCGVSPFYAPRSNPDGWAVTVHCLTGDTVRAVEVRRFDGVHWEDFIAGSGIRAFSKQD